MTVLVADDLETNRKLLTAVLIADGYQVVQARNGGEALEILKQASEPMVALLDWQMPVLPGIEVCREARKGANSNLLFIILVTVRDSKPDVVAGLSSGANDYVTKPFDNDELLARVRIGAQMVELQQSLMRRVRELEEAAAQIKELSGLLPICSYCKKIRDDQHYWQEVEEFIAQHSDAKFRHAFCPECFEKHLRPDLERMGFSEADLRPQKKSRP
jgi:CheY-like chemotaxis protein